MGLSIGSNGRLLTDHKRIRAFLGRVERTVRGMETVLRATHFYFPNAQGTTRSYDIPKRENPRIYLRMEEARRALVAALRSLASVTRLVRRSA
ncbi:hypothetical protein G7K_0401-t1 [Saitoella complicata NRRL Y-17804]|uniref:Uncharacterized protein n=1 Tax=Saitoella complicata (strain BCRC 22490 / CBS 7301 / JCM 7358 / NBRC 10748 / NRRL Y-17804) TaxID=698492 RepID=A0A0E9N8L4_SAICN|nr:hypothetical protein G7K_0401-t1 [Saitoella complicata NRRL Y-17804]